MFKSSSEFHGIYPMAYAFFHKDGSLWREPIVKLVGAMVASGVHGVAVLGLASEVNKLSLRERSCFLEWVSEEVGGRVPLCATVAENSVGGQIEFARHAFDTGADWVILQPPPVYDLSENELLAFFSEVIERIDGPVGVQNAPVYLKIGLSNAGLAELSRRHSNFVTVKAEDSAVGIARLVEETEGSVAVFNGRGGLELPDAIRAGVTGIIPGGESFDVFARAYELMRAGDDKAAEACYREILPLVVFLEDSIDHLVTYGKRIAARRCGIDEVFSRSPSIHCSAFGLNVAQRFADRLGPFE